MGVYPFFPSLSPISKFPFVSTKPYRSMIAGWAMT